MITTENLKSLKLGIQPINDELCLLVESAINWINDNTTISVDKNNLEALQANARLFIIKYVDIMKLPVGISSESVSGLSQSFDTGNKEDMLLSFAYSLFGDDKVTAGKVSFVSAKNRWN